MTTENPGPGYGPIMKTGQDIVRGWWGEAEYMLLGTRLVPLELCTAL